MTAAGRFLMLNADGTAHTAKDFRQGLFGLPGGLWPTAAWGGRALEMCPDIDGDNYPELMFGVPDDGSQDKGALILASVEVYLPSLAVQPGGVGWIACACVWGDQRSVGLRVNLDGMVGNILVCIDPSFLVALSWYARTNSCHRRPTRALRARR